MTDESLLLEMLIEEIKGEGEDFGVLVEDVLEIVDVADERANDISLVFDDLFFQVVSETGVIVIALVVVMLSARVVTVDVVGADQKLLLDFNSQAESFDFVDIFMSQDRNFVSRLE